jgi:hypothetical protein
VNEYSGSAPIVLTICGDPVVGRALLVLLRNPRYEVRLLSVSSLSEPRGLEGVRLVLFAPTPQLSTERRKALLALLKGMPSTSEIPILELISSEETREGVAQYGWEHALPWPCKTEVLERRIETVLFNHAREAQLHCGPL